MISYEQMQDLENESQIDTHSCVNGIEESITLNIYMVVLFAY